MNKKIIIIGIILFFLMMSVNYINASEINNTKKDSKICVWEYYPTSEKIGNLEYMVYYDKDKDNHFSETDPIIQNIEIKKFRINKQGKYEVNINFNGNNEYKPSYLNYTVVFTGKEDIGGYETRKYAYTYKKYGHTYKKYKLYWNTKYLNGKVSKEFIDYETILTSRVKYRLLNKMNVKLYEPFFKKGIVKAYYNGKNKIKAKTYGYFNNKLQYVGYVELINKGEWIYYKYSNKNTFTFNFYGNPIYKKIVNKYKKYL